MADFTAAVAIVEGAIFPIRRQDSADRNGLKRLGTTAGGAEDGDDARWFDASREFLDAEAPNEGDNRVLTGGARDAAGSAARDFPWYAVFETADGEIWAGRFFDDNLPGDSDFEGVVLLDADPADVDPADLASAAAIEAAAGCTLPRRAVVAATRDSITGAASSAKDHGGGGGAVRQGW